MPSDLTVCSGQDLALTASLSDVPAGTQTYLWESEILSGPGAAATFAPDATSLATTVEFPVVAATTVYKITFTLTVTPAGGCADPIVAKFITSITVDPLECQVMIDNCPGDITECYDGDGDTPVDWIIPDASFNCCSGGVDDNASFVVEFDLPESMNECWVYNYVQRIGSNNLRVFQSTGTGPDTFYISPLQYFNTSGGVPVTQEMIVPSGAFDWTLQVLDGVTEAVVWSDELAGINSNGVYTITIPDTVPNGSYKLKFLFDDNGLGLNASDKIEVDRLYYNAILLDDCADGLNFVVTATHVPGDEFPIGTTQVTYTATLTIAGGGTPIVETCTFDVTIVEVSIAVDPTDVSCNGADDGEIDL